VHEQPSEFGHRSKRVRNRVDAAERELRIDLFRGLALWLIFLDHIPANSVSWITIRNYGFSDAAEIFIFISGYTAALVYGRSMRDHGFAIAAARILRRAWHVYAAHVFLFAVYAAEVMYAASAYDAPIFAQKAQIMIFLQHPGLTLIHAVLLNFKPVNLDVLPVYVLFLLGFAPALWLLQRAPTLILAASGTLYGFVRICGWDISAYPDGAWFFNPLAWQFLFVLGAWGGAGGGERLWGVLSSRSTVAAAAVYLISAFLLAMTWHSAPFRHFEPDWLKQLVIHHPIDKTNLHPLRLIHFLALATIAVRLVPNRWPVRNLRLLRPVLVCGRYSLQVFCLGVLLAFAAHVAILEISSTVTMQVLASAIGIAAMIAFAELLAWNRINDPTEAGRLRGSVPAAVTNLQEINRESRLRYRPWIPREGRRGAVDPRRSLPSSQVG
jgi:hypothetical protein